MNDRYTERRNKLGSMLPKNSAVVIAGASTQYRNADSSHAFRQDSNFWYLSGFNEAESTLVLLINENNDVQSIAFVPEKDQLKEIWDGYRAGPEGAMKDHGFDLAFNNTEIDQRLPDLLAGRNQVFYPVGKSQRLDADIIEWIKSAKSKDRHSSAIDIADASSKVGNQRLIKDEDEIKIMKKACQISAEAHVEAMKFVKPGMTEQEMEAFYQYEFSKRGGRFSAYTPIVAGGENACVLHYVENSKALQDGELLLVDAGCEFELYASDITRTYPINGKFTAPQLAIYEVVLEAQLKSIEAISTNNNVMDAQIISEKVITQGLIDLGILQGSMEELHAAGAFKDFYMHKIGHWLGIDVHDAGDYMEDGEYMKFKPGMVTTVEPGIYISSSSDVEDKWKGIGIRIEDDILVTADGNENLTAFVPSNPKEIEALMA
ncbi:aminopeptidase P N-terminal domain-containing protein [Gammaproteobacteria bacterium]|jgi:Xaa-Pro aminopeptidase|nr:aminopeptidase P N-terminal domain-containing protein [SAR86 cluster bacterium]MDA8709824.1 aminopeptidase P N-terminal domain-containing protein [Gammaproteobacteria bacterium]MBL6701719.1 aminopeptidase P N-terminal domain-containing protein [SAR86 cluster bacterium]MDA8798491.1 aminopeptidase P N-terminal domain-containing protein [Gammaproteobacteria bacterium]MDA9936573.1 aminopeptidase P N-terminal domain-containing protein [Gammaproteobacteria bacterium]